ncbi:MAG: serine/threonine protein kinase [Pseudomonadales bacterium]|nr:serine/threonine protein kinase [Pseudomonadales bacterium]
MALDKSSSIPGYHIIKEIGQGGMATVYLAEQESDGCKIALKIIKPNLCKEHSWNDRFLYEAEVISQLSHPNIMPLLDIGQVNDQSYLAMEYIKGGNLADKIQQGLSIEDVINTLRDIATGLDFAGSNGFIHRDIKPENILFREDGTAVILDFGIAKSVNDNSRFTQTGVIVGTTSYMSPEQAQDFTLDPRSDIYSLGIVLYEMLTGAVPFQADSMLTVLMKHINNEPEPLPKNAALFQTIMDKMLAKQPQERYQNAAEILTDLDTLQYAHDNAIRLPVKKHGKNRTAASRAVATHISKKDLLPAIGIVLLLTIPGISGAVYMSTIEQQEQSILMEKRLITQDLKTAKERLNDQPMQSMTLLRDVLKKDKHNQQAIQLMQQLEHNYIAKAGFLITKKDIEATEQLFLQIKQLKLPASAFIETQIQLAELKKIKVIELANKKARQELMKNMPDILPDVPDAAPLKPVKTQRHKAVEIKKSEAELLALAHIQQLKSQKIALKAFNETLEINALAQAENNAKDALFNALSSQDFAQQSNSLNDAWFAVQQTFSIDENNIEAKKVQKTIIAVYENKLKLLIDDKSFDNAKIFLKQIQENNISSLKISHLTKRLKEKMRHKNRVLTGGF